jgi:hypothetical protein
MDGPAPSRDGPPPIGYRTLRISAGILALAVCVGIAVGLVVMFAAARTVSTPGFVVTSYLNDVQHGDIDAAMKLDGHVQRTEDVLMSNKAYAKVTDRVTSSRLLSTTVRHASAHVRASVVQHSGTSVATFELRRGAWTPLALLGFESWKLQPVPMTTITVTIGAPGRVAATVAGVDLKWKGSILTLDAFPGTYPLAISSTNAWFTLRDASTTVNGFGSHTDLKTPAVLTQKGSDAIRAAANTWLDTCAAKTVFQPSGCSFGLTRGPDAGQVWTNQTWTIATRPQLSISAWDFNCHSITQADVSVGGCWRVTSPTPGTVTFHADYTTPATGDFGVITSLAPIAATVKGMATSFTGTGAIFQSIQWTQ